MISLTSLHATAGVFGRIAREVKAVAALALLALSLTVSASVSVSAAEPSVERMPSALESRYALSALPPPLRDAATLYLLNPSKGYVLAKQGTSGITCLVERTAWEKSDFQAIFVPLCYDAVGTRTYLKVIMDVAALRAQGIAPAALKLEIEKRYKDGTYKAPQRPGISYMMAPLMRTWMLPDWKVHTAPMPHFMYYAPNLTNQEIDANPRNGVLYPFVMQEGLPQQSYLVQVLGAQERAQLLADNAGLLRDLCAYRSILCLPKTMTMSH